MNSVQIDVSRNWAEDRIPAILVIESAEAIVPKDALARFRRAVSQWLANTGKGKEAWEDSVHDFNYGDFRMHDVAKDADFIRFLRANGLESARVERYAASDCGEHWDHSISPEGA
jgi:hypothetical protein